MPSESSKKDLFDQSVELSTGRLLVVDDELDLLAALTQMLQKQGYEVSGCGSAEEALSALQEQDFDLLLTDLMMPKLSGIELFQAAVKIDPHLVVIIMTGQGTIQSAVEALKAGIFDYILKPFKLRAVLPVLARALEVRRLRMQNLQLRQTMAIYELGQTISYTLDLDAILDKVVDGAMQQCEADEASIMLPTRQADELYVAAVRGPQRSHLLGERVPIDKHIVGWVARQRQPLTLSGGVKDPRFEPKRGRADILFSAILPLIVGSKFVGILNLNFTHYRRPLTVGELKALSILTTIAGATLDDTRLYRDLAESEQKLRSLLEQSIEGIVLANGEGQIVEWNGSAEKIFGLKKGEVLGRKLWDVQFQTMPDEQRSAESHERLKAPIMEFLKTKEAPWLGRFLEVTVQWPDKTLRTVEMTLFPIRMDEAFLFGCMARDVTERKKNEEELQRKHTLLRTLVDNLPVYFYLKDRDCRFLMNNPAHLKVLEASKQEEVAGKTDFDFFPRERAEQYHVDEQEILRTGQPLLNKEEEVIDHAGERRWVLTIKVPLRDESGSVVGIVGMGQDITERKKAEERIEHLNRVLRAIRGVNQLIVREKSRPRLIQRACETLVETRGFNAAWIVLTDQLPGGLGSGQAGIPEPAFSRFAALFRAGTLPRCCGALQSRRTVVLTKDPRAVCADCPLVGVYNETCALTASLRHEEHHYGYLGVSVPASAEIDEQGLSLLDELAGDLGFALHGVETEEAQRESEQSLRIIFDNALDGIMVADAQTQRFINANRAICRMLGYAFEELKGLSVADIHPAESLGYVTAEFEKQLKGETALARDLPVKRKDGSVFYADVNAAPIELHGRTHLLGLFRDVTERRHAEQKLRDANEKLQDTQQRLALQARWVQALNSVGSDIARRNNLESILRVVMHYLEESFAFATGGIGLRSEDGSYSTIVVQSSRGRSLAQRMGVQEGTRLPATHSFLPAGRDSTEPLTISLTDLDLTDLPAPSETLLRRTQRLGFKAVLVVPLATDRARSGELFMLYRQAVSLSEPELGFLRGMAEYVSLAIQNRSLYDELEGSYRQLQATQQVMMQQERLKAMGQMASGIAHDINNTLAPITLYTEALAASELGQKEPARRYLSTIQSAVGDIEGITMRLRAFYKAEGQAEMEALDIRELFDSVLELSRPRWKDIPNRKGVEIRMEREVASRLPSLLGSLTEVREALINLVFNAVDALPQGGTITLRARKREEHLCVEVADTGVGMNEEQKRRCLEPFYTTKGAEGTGLGLSVVFGTMQRHKGELEIESEPGQGTTVRLLFPLPHRRPRRPAPGERPPGSELPPLRILCIDDNLKVREALKEMLVQNGHQVEACADGEEALVAFQSSQAGKGSFDLVITDLGMPHMDGKALARRIKELSPGTPVILLSGWGKFMNLSAGLPENVDCLLGKPPTMARLLAAIREVLSSTRRGRSEEASE